MDTSALEALPEEVLKEILALKEAEIKLEVREKAQDQFMPFVHHVYDGFIEGRHHRIIAEKLERIAKGELKRLIVNMPPRHSKSEFASFLMPAWFLGRNPKLKIIQATHNTELAVRFGRKVRDLMGSDTYRDIFSNVHLKSDDKAAGRWGTAEGGEYFAAGVGAAVTGRGADLFIIDDPHSEQDALSETAFDHAYEWYTSGPRQRLQPGGAIIVVMCMTGDTPVLMSNGQEKNLKDIRPGDTVATYDEGRLKTAKINNWQSSGLDHIYKIQTRSGKMLRANERHPFLVMNEGVPRWIRLSQLKVGDELVSLKDAAGLLEQKQSLESAEPVKPKILTTGKIPKLLITQWGITGNGRIKSVLNLAAQSLWFVKDSARHITTKNIGLLGEEEKLQNKAEITDSNLVTVLRLKTIMQWLQSVTINVTSAANSLLKKTLGRIGAESFASITATTLEKLGGFCVTTAILPLVTEKPQKSLNELQRTSDFTTDPIVSITPDGVEEVFDVEVDRTENFIANGIVSHNTRWGTKDLTGRLLKAQGEDVMSDEWEVVEFPAIMPSDEPLWPEFWNKDDLLKVKAALPLAKWNAQWQQKPTASEGAIVKKEWWNVWEEDEVPPVKYIMQSYDTAFSKKETADYSAITTWGVFEPEEGGPDHLILLDAKRGRYNFPELKQVALEEHDYWEPDMVIIEAKATGTPLTDELRRTGIPVMNYTPGKGRDKVTRMHTVAPLFEAGMVWAPDKKFAEEVVDEVASFPYGDHDDYVDSMTMALIRFRQGGFLTLAGEEDDELDEVPTKREYY